MRKLALVCCAFLTGWLAVGRPVAAMPAVAQTGPAAACKECQDLADKIRQLDETQRNLVERLRETAAKIEQITADLSLAQADLARVRQAPPSGERTSQTQQLERRISGMQSEIKQQSAYAERLEGQRRSLRGDLLVLSVELEACNRRCERKASSSTPPTGTGFQPGTGVPRLPAPVAKCPECRPAADRLKQLQDQRLDLAERLETYKARLAAIHAETDRLLTELKELATLSKGRALTSAEGARSRQIMERVDDLGATLFGPATRLVLVMSDLERELRKLDDEIVRALDELNKCNDRCGTKETGSLFTKPAIYAVAAAVAGGGVLVGTRGDNPSTASAAPPVNTAPTQPTGTTPPAAPPPPQGSSISGTYSLTGTLQTQDCRVAGIVPVFPPNFTGGMTLQIGSDNTGTATTRHANGWMFSHRVQVTPTATGFQVRSQTPHQNSQPFGGVWEAVIEFQVSAQFTISGLETHTRLDGGAGCKDVIAVQGARQ